MDHAKQHTSFSDLEEIMAKGATKISTKRSISMFEEMPNKGDRKAITVMDLVKESNQFLVEPRHTTKHVLR